MAPRTSSSVVPPNLGLYLQTNPYTVPPRAVVDGMNFRVKNGKIGKNNLGWAPFFPTAPENTATTKLLLHFTGTDASTLIYDSAAGRTAKKAWTVNGNAQLDTSQFKFGPSSLLLDGTGDDIVTANHADFALGSNSFRIESWFRDNSAGGSSRFIASHRAASGAAADTAWQLCLINTDEMQFCASDGSNFTCVTSTTKFTNALNPGFHHVRVVRVGNSLKLFVDGVLEGQVSFVGSVNAPNQTLQIGSANGGGYWNGWIDEVLIDVGGTQPFTEFTPPTSPYNTPLWGSNGEFAGPAMMADKFITRDAGEHVIFFTDRNIYRLVEAENRVVFLNPAYSTGTVTAAGTAITGVGTDWSPLIKPGDEMAFGTAIQNDPGAQWYTIATVNSDTSITLDESVVETVSGAAYTIRRTFTGAADDIWSTETFVAPDDGVGDDLYFVTNGVDPICTWDATSTFMVSRESLNFTCKYLAVFKNMMLYANITETGGDFLPTDFINSDVGIPLEVVLGLAGQFRVHDGPDHIRNLEELGDNIVFYSERTLTHVQFVGDPLVFIFRSASTGGNGLIASRLLADFGDYHEFVGQDTLYKFDGVSVQEVGQQVWREVLRTRDPVRHEMGFCHFDEENGELHFVIALTSDAGVGIAGASPERSYVEHYLEIPDTRIQNPFSVRSLPFNGSGFANVSGVLTWADLTNAWETYGLKWNDSFQFAAFPLNIFAKDDGRIYTINIVTTANGTALPSFVTFPRRLVAPTNSYAQGLLTRVYSFMETGTGNVTVTTRFYDHPNGPVSRSKTNSFDLSLPQEGHFVTPYGKGRAFDIGFSTDTEDWMMNGYDTEIKLEGVR